MRKDGAYIKLERIKQIQKQIVSSFPGEVDFNKIVLWAEMNIGLTNETAQEYVTKIVEVNGWVLENGKIKAEV